MSKRAAIFAIYAQIEDDNAHSKDHFYDTLEDEREEIGHNREIILWETLMLGWVKIRATI